MTVLRKTGRLAPTLRDLQQVYDIIIVDTAGKDSVELRSAALVSDVLLTPTADPDERRRGRPGQHR